MNIGEPLTWNELADLYDKVHSGKSARTLPMDIVFSWAEKQKDNFYVDPVEGTIHIYTANNSNHSLRNK